jgi:ferredoxin
MCVYICAEVFEKPVANRCARVRLGVNPTQYAAQVREAAEYCPVDAIRIAEPREVNDVARCSNRFLSPMRNAAKGVTCAQNHAALSVWKLWMGSLFWRVQTPAAVKSTGSIYVRTMPFV